MRAARRHLAVRAARNGAREPQRSRSMKEPFTLERSYVAATDWYSLKRELFGYTSNEHEASSILRSLENLAGDPTITRFEITPEPNPYKNVYPGAAEAVWKVTPI